LAQPYSAGSGQTENRRDGTENFSSAQRAYFASRTEIATVIETVALTQIAALGEIARTESPARLKRIPWLTGPQTAAELRSTWTLRLRSGQAREGARPHTTPSARQLAEKLVAPQKAHLGR
jgi:hypothetical protein